MFSDPLDWTQAALELLEAARTSSASPVLLSALEVGAATLANHTWDAHERTGWPPTTKGEFATAFPEWDILRLISNGAKHPQNPKWPDISLAEFREVDWENAEFWDAPDQTALVVPVGEGDRREDRAVSVLVRAFITAYTDHVRRLKGSSEP